MNTEKENSILTAKESLDPRSIPEQSLTAKHSREVRRSNSISKNYVTIDRMWVERATQGDVDLSKAIFLNEVGYNLYDSQDQQKLVSNQQRPTSDETDLAKSTWVEKKFVNEIYRQEGINKTWTEKTDSLARSSLESRSPR